MMRATFIPVIQAFCPVWRRLGPDCQLRPCGYVILGVQFRPHRGKAGLGYMAAGRRWVWVEPQRIDRGRRDRYQRRAYLRLASFCSIIEYTNERGDGYRPGHRDVH